MKNCLAFVIGRLFLITALAITACTDEHSRQDSAIHGAPPAKSNRIIVTYELPENQEYLHIYSLFKEDRHLLENLQELLSPMLIKQEIN